MGFVSKHASLAKGATIGRNVTINEGAHVGPHASVLGNAYLHGITVLRDSAIVRGQASVFDSVLSDRTVIGGRARVQYANIRGDGHVMKSSDYLVVGPAVSSGRFTTAHRDREIGVRVNTGCFSGSLGEFHEAILKTHKEGSRARAQYLLFYGLIVRHATFFAWSP